MKTILVLGLILCLSCGMVYKPTIPLSVEIPDSLFANAVTAFKTPLELPVVYAETCFVSLAERDRAELDSLRRESQIKTDRENRRSEIADILWVGLHVVTCVAVLLR